MGTTNQLIGFIPLAVAAGLVGYTAKTLLSPHTKKSKMVKSRLKSPFSSKYSPF